MSVSKNKRKRKGGHRPNKVSSAQTNIEDIARIAGEIATASEAGPLWGQLHKLFLRSSVDTTVVAAIIMHRDEAELAKIIGQLQRGEETAVVEEIATEPLEEIPFQTKKEAMRVFRRRAKFIKLDRESKLGVGPLTSGKTAKFDSIEAPHDFPSAVWQALADEGQLINDGGGFYKLP